MDRFIEFYKEIGKKLPEEELTYSFPNARIRERFIKEILKRYNDVVLDLGCGEGRLTAHKKVVGIDISFEKLIRARRKNPDGIYISGDIENLNFLKKKFNIVLISEVIEHLREPEKFLKSLDSVVEKNGIIIITTPNKLRRTKETFSVESIKHFGIKNGIENNEYFHRSFTREEIKSLVQNAGFKILEIGTLENEFRGIGKPILLLKRLPRFYWYFAPKVMDYLYNFMNDTGLIKIQKFIFKEGIRLYVIAQKNT